MYVRKIWGGIWGVEAGIGKGSRKETCGNVKVRGTSELR